MKIYCCGCQKEVEDDIVVYHLKKNIRLNVALGLIRGSLLGKEMAEFNKEGLFKNLERVEKILTEFLEQNDDK